MMMMISSRLTKKELDIIIAEEMELKNYDYANLRLSLNHLDLTEADRDIITSG